MRKTAPLLFIAALIASAPAIADARPDGDRGGDRGGGWRGGGGQAERGGGGGRWGGGDRGGGPRWGGGDRGGGPGRWNGGGDRGGEGRWSGAPRGGDRGGDWRDRANFGGDNAPERDRPPPQGRGPNSLREGYAPQQDEARRGVREGGFVPLPNVLNSLRRQRPGRQLDTGIEDFNGRPSYRVRWVDQNGQRMDFIVDARTGAVMSVEGR